MEKLKNVFCAPVQFASGLIHCDEPNNHKARKVTECALGFCVCLTASAVAVSYPAGCVIPHFAYDALAYLLHGFGSVPILDAVTRD